MTHRASSFTLSAVQPKVASTAPSLRDSRACHPCHHPCPGGLERASSVRYLFDRLNLPNCLSFQLGALETTPSAHHPRLSSTLLCPDNISSLRFSGCAQFLAYLHCFCTVSRLSSIDRGKSSEDGVCNRHYLPSHSSSHTTRNYFQLRASVQLDLLKTYTVYGRKATRLSAVRFELTIPVS